MYLIRIIRIDGSRYQRAFFDWGNDAENFIKWNCLQMQEAIQRTIKKVRDKISPELDWVKNPENEIDNSRYTMVLTMDNQNKTGSITYKEKQDKQITILIQND